MFVSRPRYLQILREFLASDTDYEEEQHVEHLEGCKGLNRGEKKFFRYLSIQFIPVCIHIRYIYIYIYICTDEQSTTDFRLTFQALAVAR